MRPYVKWDDQPASPGAACEALLRAAWLTATQSMTPADVNLDAEMQESALSEPLPPLDAARFFTAVASAARPSPPQRQCRC